MGRGTWSRWGRGGCEGYSIAFGDLVTGQVTKGAGGWQASLGPGHIPLELSKGVNKFEAMAKVEAAMEAKMSFALEEWAIYQQSKASK